MPDRVQHPGADSLSYWQTHDIFAVVSTHHVQTVCVLCASTRGQEVGSHSCVQQSLEARAGGRVHIYISDFVSVSLERGSSLSLVNISFVIIYYNMSGLHQPDG